MRRQPGDVIGRFVIRAPLGAGGMGEVYRATDTRLQRDVALKVMNARRLGDPAARRRWVVEARAAAALTHPNIVVVHEIGEDDDLYIAMELVEGRSLRDVLQDGPLLAERVHNLASDIASALAAAHRRGIVHRDIKPENILITDAGHAKVLDFGIAKVVDNPDDARDVGDASTVAQATAPGLIIGAPSTCHPSKPAEMLSIRGRTSSRSASFSTRPPPARSPFRASDGSTSYPRSSTTSPLRSWTLGSRSTSPR